MVSILIVDDDRLKRISLEKQLQDRGYTVISCDNAFFALQKLDENEFEVVVTDLKMAGMDGIGFLKEAKKKIPSAEFIVMTAYGSIETAVEAIRSGAFDYITKPFMIEELAIKIEHLIERQNALREVESLKRRLSERYQFHQLVAVSKTMRDLFAKSQLVADQEVPVLIQGETGAGKELLAQAIHFNSMRSKEPFMPLSCAVLNPNILESEIFGHEAGAFTGATRQKRGRLELAGKGTLFLDDIDDIPLDIQVKLLRVVQEKKYERVGGEQSLSFQARLISASKRDLRQMVAEGKFRDDLMYRLDVVHMTLPPLRERREDIHLLLEHFSQKYGLLRDFSHEAMKILLEHDWPGNVRELENVVLQVLALGKTGPVVNIQDLPVYLLEAKMTGCPYSLNLQGSIRLDIPQMLDEIQKACIQWAMRKTGGNQSLASELLNIPRTTLRRYISEMDSAKED